MRKSYLCLAVSAALFSGEILADTSSGLKTYAVTAPEQRQLASKTNGIQSLIDARSARIASIQEKVRNRLESAGIKVERQLKNLGAISFAQLDSSQIDSLRADGYTVEEMGTKYLVEGASIQAQDTPWGIDRVRAPEAWATYDGTGVKVCVIDTGIDYNHDDLKDNFVTGVSTVGIGEGGSGSGDPMDVHYHGTHVAGTIAAANNDLGVVGVAPGAGLYAVAAFSPSGSAEDPDILAGLDWCAEQNADVVSMSYGGSSSTEAEETAYQAAFDSGMVLVAASGNDGATAPILYPARYPWTITVGATTSSNNIASFSQRGPELDVVAPGSGIDSTEPGNGYRIASGTSMATPHVSGVAAVAIAKIKASGNESLINTDYLRDYLKASALDLGPAGRDDTFGSGLVDAQAVLDVLDGGNLKPVASYSYDLNDLTIDLTNNSYDRDGEITSVSWDLGDGTTSTGWNLSHTYAAYGTYTVSLSVTDDAGDASLSTQEINVRQIPGGALENGVAFTDIAGSQGDEYHWWLDVDAPSGEQLDALSFDISGGSGDADIYVRYGAKPTTSTYDYRPYKGGNDETVDVNEEDLQEGRWYVMIRAYRDYSGVDLVGSYTSSGAPDNVAPEAGFSHQTSDLTAYFTDSSLDSDGSIVSWAWDFGDGNSSSAQNPTHTYASAGGYNVELTVNDDDGATAVASQIIVVDEPCTEDCGATYSNNNQLVIDDNDWLGVRSPITVDRSGDSSIVTVTVRIVHDDPDQLLVKLRAPDGTKWYVSKYEEGNVSDGIDKALSFDASGIDASGTWKLYLYDRTSGVEGYLDNWSITFPAQ